MQPTTISALSVAPATTAPTLLTVTEAAAQLRVDPATVRRWIAAGRLPAIKPGRDYRIASTSVAQLLAGSLVESRPLSLTTTL